MFGSWPVVIRSARPFSIHGDLYYEILVDRTDDPSAGATLLKVPHHAVTTEPAVGAKVTVTFLMGQVTAVARRRMIATFSFSPRLCRGFFV